MAYEFYVDVTTKLHSVMVHIGNQIYVLGCMRWAFSEDNEMLHRNFKELYSSTKRRVQYFGTNFFILICSYGNWILPLCRLTMMLIPHSSTISFADSTINLGRSNIIRCSRCEDHNWLGNNHNNCDYFPSSILFDWHGFGVCSRKVIFLQPFSDMHIYFTSPHTVLLRSTVLRTIMVVYYTLI